MFVFRNTFLFITFEIIFVFDFQNNAKQLKLSKPLQLHLLHPDLTQYQKKYRKSLSDFRFTSYDTLDLEKSKPKKVPNNDHFY